jgi:hypothetical protein
VIVNILKAFLYLSRTLVCVVYLCSSIMVNAYRRDMAKPGYRMRGTGTWIAPRAGSYYNRIDDAMYYRGAGFRDWIKQAASTALRALIKFVVPHVKQSGPDVAQMLAKYAAQKAAAYVTRSEKLGPAQGMVSQALSDLPNVVKDLVQKQIDDKFEPLSERVLQNLQARGGAAPENRELMAQQTIVDAMPYIERELIPLREKLELIEMFGERMSSGKAREAHDALEKLSARVSSENTNAPLTPVRQLVESMITAVMQFLAKTNNLPTGMEHMADSCCRICSTNNTLTMSPVISRRLREFDELGLDMGPKIPQLTAIMPGLGAYEIPSDDTRGGFLGMAASLAPMLMGIVPALVSGGMEMIGKLIPQSYTDRGSGREAWAETERQMANVFEGILNKHISQSTANHGSHLKRHTKTVTSRKPSNKRQKVL